MDVQFGGNKQIVYSATLLGNIPNNSDALQTIIESVSSNSYAGNRNINGNSPGKTVSWLELLNQQSSQNNINRRPISPIKDRLIAQKQQYNDNNDEQENNNGEDDDSVIIIKVPSSSSTSPLTTFK